MIEEFIALARMSDIHEVASTTDLRRDNEEIKEAIKTLYLTMDMLLDEQDGGSLEAIVIRDYE